LGWVIKLNLGTICEDQLLESHHVEWNNF
jgi:hypothetical protein